jgi:capsular polysaccharide biosynthesis protein
VSVGLPVPTKQPERLRVGLISRKNRRCITNEAELVSAARDAGIELELLSLETLSFREQVPVSSFV